MRTLGFVLALTLAAVPIAAADPTSAPAQLATSRAELAARIYASVKTRWQAGTTTVDNVTAWSVRWLDAASSGARGKALAKLLDEHADRMRTLETEATQARDAGRITPADVDVVTYFRLEAELWATRGKR